MPDKQERPIFKAEDAEKYDVSIRKDMSAKIVNKETQEEWVERIGQ